MAAKRQPCAFCGKGGPKGKGTTVNPRTDAKNHNEGARLPHSPTKLGFTKYPPLCVAVKQGEKAQRLAATLLDVPGWEIVEVIHHKHSAVCDLLAEAGRISNTVVHNVTDVACDYLPTL